MQVRDEAPVFNTVTSEEFDNIVRKRREQDDFVVDDDGLGYADNGEEDFERSDDGGYDDEMEPERKRKNHRDGDKASKRNKVTGERRVSDMFKNIGSAASASSNTIGPTTQKTGSTTKPQPVHDDGRGMFLHQRNNALY